MEGDRAVCDLSTVLAPNDVGSTLFVNKSGSDAELIWTAPPADATHDPAAYYRVRVSGAPDGGFTVEHETRETSVLRPLTDPGGFFLVSAVNAAGESEEVP